MSLQDAPPSNAVRWAVAALVVLCLVLMLAIVRGEPGAGGRDPGTDDEQAASIVRN